MVSKYTLTIGDVLNNGKKCTTPIVEVVGDGDFYIACIDKQKGVYELEGVLPQDKCIDIIVSCGDCHDCPPKEIRKCVCDGDQDCGPCETCGDSGFCETRCAPGFFCLSDNCVECDPDHPCLDGKVCKNGRCVCPQNKPFLVGGRCLECIKDEPCRECVDGVFVNKQCSGVCDPASNGCVDCLVSSDCDGDNECCASKECVCCEGFSRNQQGICIPTPECDENNPCGPCKTCIEGNCEQNVCPPGKICIGSEGCVDECACNQPVPCSSNTASCLTTEDGCGCVPCKGDCASGCSDGCFCNGSICVGDVCFGGKCPCQDGTDCPAGYGCDGQNCVPCASLSCTTVQCAQTLGCGCANGKCIDLDVSCGNTPCTTSNDCGFGCACNEGICTSCDNFTCAECGQISGCGCSGVACEGLEELCADTFTMTKNSNCTLTATLTKSEACACPPVTVNIQTRRRSVADGNSYKLEFSGEVRKGVYTGALDIPLMDNILSPNIVENDSPTSGKITITSVAQYREYTVNPVNGVRSSPTVVTETARILEGSFITGTTASVALGELEYEPFNTVIVTERDGQGRVVKEIKYFRVDITAKITDDFDFPNTCTYKDGDTIGTYRLLKNDDFVAFGFAFGNHIAKTITTSESRLPIFRWYKSATEVISSTPFRKRYIPVGVNGKYIDTISKVDGLEACKFFKVVSDCTCATSPGTKAIFCNPEDLQYTVTGCNKQITIGPEIVVPCDVNKDVEYYFRAGSVYQKWLGSRWDVVAGSSFTSTSIIRQVEFGQVCDTENTCKKVYDVPFALDTLVISPEPVCSTDGLYGTFVVPNTDDGARCNLTSLSVGGVSYAPGATVTVSSGVTQYTATWACGCEPTMGTVEFVCCEGLTQTITRRCAGNVICSSIPGVTYSVGTTVIPDLCAYVSSLPRSSSVTIVGTRPGCTPFSIFLPEIQNACCELFDLAALDSGTGNVPITVFGEVNAPITITRTDGLALANGEAIAGSGSNRTFINVDRTLTYTLTAVSAFGCAPEAVTIVGREIAPGPGVEEGPPLVDDTPPTTPGGSTVPLAVQANSDQAAAQPITATCGQATQLTRVKSGGIYTLRGEVIPQNCPCGSGVIDFAVTQVANTVGSNNLQVSYDLTTTATSQILDTGNEVLIFDAGRRVEYFVPANGSGTLTIPKSFTTSESLKVFRYEMASEILGPGNIRYARILKSATASSALDLNTIASSSLTFEANGVVYGPYPGVLTGDGLRIDFVEEGIPNTGRVVSTTVGDSTTVKSRISLVFTDGTSATATRDSIHTRQSQVSGTTSPSGATEAVVITTYTENLIYLQARTHRLPFEDGCLYTGITPSITLDSGGVEGALQVSTPINAYTAPALTKFQWKENGVDVLTTYAQSTSQFPTADATIGADYLLTTMCGGCEETQGLRLCPPIAGTVTLNNCFTAATVTITGDEGRAYNVIFDNTIVPVTITGGVGVATFDPLITPLTASTTYTVTVGLVGTASCTATFKFTTGATVGVC